MKRSKANIYDDDLPMTLKQKIVIYSILFLIGFFVGWIIKLKINEPKYITKVEITYYNDKKETLYYDDKQEFYLNEGDLHFVNNNTIASYVKSYKKFYIEQNENDKK